MVGWRKPAGQSTKVSVQAVLARYFPRQRCTFLLRSAPVRVRPGGAKPASKLSSSGCVSLASGTRAVRKEPDGNHHKAGSPRARGRNGRGREDGHGRKDVPGPDAQATGGSVSADVPFAPPGRSRNPAETTAENLFPDFGRRT